MTKYIVIKELGDWKTYVNYAFPGFEFNGKFYHSSKEAVTDLIESTNAQPCKIVIKKP